MKFFLDFFPVAIFVGVYAFSGADKPMYPAVMALMVATVIQNIGTKLLTGKFEKLHLWTLVITLVFGTMTLVFRNPAFIFWKASVLLWVMAAVFLYRQVFLDKLLLEEMLSKTVDEPIPAPKAVWKQLNALWIIAYIIIGFVNIYIAYNFSEAFWVKFKLFGLMGLNLVLLIVTMTKIYPYLPIEEDENKQPAVDSGDSAESSADTKLKGEK